MMISTRLWARVCERLTEWMNASHTKAAVASKCCLSRNSGVKRTAPRGDGSMTYTPGTVKTGTPLPHHIHQSTLLYMVPAMVLPC